MENRMSSQSFSTPAMFMVKAELRPMRAKTDMLRAAKAQGAGQVRAGKAQGAGRGRAGQGRAGQGRAGQGVEGIMARGSRPI